MVGIDSDDHDASHFMLLFHALQLAKRVLAVIEASGRLFICSSHSAALS